MRKLILLTAAVVAALYAAPAHACDLCAIYRGLEAREAETGPSIGVFEQFTHYGTLQMDGDEVSNPAGQYMDSSITQFLLGYQFSGRTGVQLTIPYINRRFRRPHEGMVEIGREEGLGDISLTGSYRFWEEVTPDTIFIWTLYGGLKLPTGDSARLMEELHEEHDDMGGPEPGIHGHDLALGSGSYDVIVGTSALYDWQRLFVSANVQYAIRTRGDFDYRYANGLYWSVKPGGYLFVTDEATLALMLGVNGESKGRDKFMGRKAEDTGITYLSLGPEIAFTWKEKISADVGADFYVVNDNTALQIAPDWRLHAAIIWRM